VVTVFSHFYNEEEYNTFLLNTVQHKPGDLGANCNGSENPTSQIAGIMNWC
jgi:hypothetical protein